MSLADHLTLGVPALFGGVPILLKLVSTLTVLFVVAGFYLGLSGTIRDNDTEQALAALSGLFALGAFLLRQWGNFHRQSLIHQKQLTDNVYYRNVNNNSGIFTYLIGEAEDQDWKEALLAYYGLLTASAPLAREALEARVEDLLAARVRRHSQLRDRFGAGAASGPRSHPRVRWPALGPAVAGRARPVSTGSGGSSSPKATGLRAANRDSPAIAVRRGARRRPFRR